MQPASEARDPGVSPYRSRLLGFLRGNSDVPELLAVEMYARGRTAVSEVREPTTEGHKFGYGIGAARPTGFVWAGAT